MSVPVDLDDPAAVAAADPGGMLRALASGAAQVRESAVLSAEAGLSVLADEGRPRAVLVCGTGSSGTAGDVLAAVAGSSCPVPVVSCRSAVLPAWVGAADLVVAVSHSGDTPETLSALEEAVRRGCRVLVVGAARSPLEDLAGRGRGLFVPVPAGRPARAAVWSLSVPLLVAGHSLGMLSAGPDALEEAARVLEEVAERCGPGADTVVNPGKSLAGELSAALPLVWGTSPLTAAAAYRFACQLHANAAVPATWGELPEVGAHQVQALQGSWAGGTSGDLFRDRADELERPVLRLVLLREPGELPAVARQADACTALAGEGGVGVSALQASGSGAPARLASLVALTDFASTYLALLEGVDPTPAMAVAELARRTSR